MQIICFFRASPSPTTSNARFNFFMVNWFGFLWEYESNLTYKLLMQCFDAAHLSMENIPGRDFRYPNFMFHLVKINC